MDDKAASRRPRISRRKLLIKAGWAVPVIVGLTLPTDALAEYGGRIDLPFGKGGKRRWKWWGRRAHARARAKAGD